MTAFISSFIENIHEQIDPVYVKEKNETKKDLLIAEMVSAAVLVTSVALGVLGIALTAGGGIGAIIGVPLILVSLPAGYLAFNAYKVFDNMKSIIENPKKYQILPSQTANKQMLINKLKQGTFCFDWAIELMLDKK